MTTDYSRKGRNYEFLIRRAFNCEKGKRYGATAELMIELYLLEVKDKESLLYKRCFQKTKNYIARALSKFKKRKRYFNSNDEFMPLLVKLHHAENVDDLTQIINKGLLKMVECENRLRESG